VSATQAGKGGHTLFVAMTKLGNLDLGAAKLVTPPFVHGFSKVHRSKFRPVGKHHLLFLSDITEST